MATFLDVTLLGGFRVVFIWLLVYVIVWGLLNWTKPFGKGAAAGPYALIALVAAFLTVISPTLRILIEFMTPWFIFLVLFIFFVIFILRMFALGDSDMIKVINHGTVHSLLVVVIIIIALFALGEAFGQRSLRATQSGTQVPVQTAPSMPVIGPDAQPNGGEMQNGGYPTQGDPNGGYAPPAGYAPPSGYAAPPTPQPGQVGATNTGDFSVNFINTIFHPKMLAIIAMILIAVVSMWMLARPEILK